MDRIYKQVPFTPLRRTESWADLLTQKRPVWPEAAPDSQAGECARARANQTAHRGRLTDSNRRRRPSLPAEAEKEVVRLLDT